MLLRFRLGWLDFLVLTKFPVAHVLTWYLYWVPLFWLYSCCSGLDLISLLSLPLLTIFPVVHVFWLDMFINVSYPDYIFCFSSLGLICLLWFPFLTIFPVAQVLAWNVYWVSLSWLYFLLLGFWLSWLGFYFLTTFSVAHVLTWQVYWVVLSWLYFLLLRSWLDMVIGLSSADFISCCSGLGLICLLFFFLPFPDPPEKYMGQR